MAIKKLDEVMQSDLLEYRAGQKAEGLFLPVGWRCHRIGGNGFEMEAASGRRYTLSELKADLVPATVRTARVKKPKVVYYVIQEGGSSGEIYLHGYDTKRSANAFRRSCDKAAYRTSVVVEVPAGLADTPGFDSAVQAILEAGLELDYLSGD